MSFLARPEPGKKISPLALRKALTGLGTLQHCALRRDGQFMVTFGETTVNPFPEELRIEDISVQLISAPTVTVRGTIFSPELAGCSPSALKEEIAEPVVSVKELPTRFAKVNSGRFLITFLGRELPESLKLSCGLILQVKAHVPVPLRCRKCYSYGHHEDSCSAVPRCPQCSLAIHPGDCAAPPKCIACGKPHPVTSAECPKWRREMEINRVRFSEGISSAEATQKVNALSKVPNRRLQPNSPALIQPGRSFAAVAGSSNNSSQPPPASSGNIVLLEQIIAQQSLRIGQLEELILQQAAKTDSLVAAMQQQTEMLMKIYAQNQKLVEQYIPEPRPVKSTRSSKRLRPDTSSPKISELLIKTTAVRDNAIASLTPQTPTSPPPVGSIFTEPPN